MSRLLVQLPPPLKVVSDPSPVDSVSGGGVASVVPAGATPPAAGSAFQIDTSDERDAPAFEFEEKAAPQAEPVRPLVMSTQRRRQQSSGSGLLTMVSVVGGGLCAIPLAQLCLWWIFGLDPVRMGPKVSGYVGVLVPEKFHARELPPMSSGDRASAGESQAPTRQRPISGGGDAVGPFGGSGQEILPPPSSPPTGVDSGANTSEAPEVDGGDVGFKIEPPDSPVNRPEGLGEFPVTTPELIDDAFQQVLVGHRVWLEAESLDDDERSASLDEFYQGYQRLGELLAFADPTSRDADRWLGLVDQTLRIQLADDQLFRFLGNRAALLFREEVAEQPEGVALSGRVLEVARVDDFWKLRVQLGERNSKAVDVMAWATPPLVLHKNDRVVVLGARLPKSSEVAWASEAGVAKVLGGYLVRLSDSQSGTPAAEAPTPF